MTKELLALTKNFQQSQRTLLACNAITMSLPRDTSPWMNYIFFIISRFPHTTPSLTTLAAVNSGKSMSLDGV